MASDLASASRFAFLSCAPRRSAQTDHGSKAIAKHSSRARTQGRSPSRPAPPDAQRKKYLLHRISNTPSASRFAFLSCEAQKTLCHGSVHCISVTPTRRAPPASPSCPATPDAQRKNKAIIKLCGHFSSYLSVAQLLVLRPPQRLNAKTDCRRFHGFPQKYPQHARAPPASPRDPLVFSGPSLLQPAHRQLAGAPRPALLSCAKRCARAIMHCFPTTCIRSRRCGRRARPVLICHIYLSHHIKSCCIFYSMQIWHQVAWLLEVGVSRYNIYIIYTVIVHDIFAAPDRAAP